MALIIDGKTACALCGLVVQGGESIVATSHFIGDKADPLWRYSDAAMHRHCFMSWEKRAAFVKRYNAVVGPRVAGNGTRQSMRDDGSIEVEQGMPPPFLDRDFRIDTGRAADGGIFVRVVHLPTGLERTRARHGDDSYELVVAQLRAELEAFLHGGRSA